MLKIDRLRISLPAGYQSRADRIARLVADELAALPVERSASCERLSVPPIEVPRAASDRRIAGSIAKAIAVQWKGVTG